MSFTANKLLLIGLACAILVGGCLLFVHAQHSKVSDSVAPLDAQTTASSTVASSTTPAMKFEIVTTPAAQAQGLGGRAVIPDNYAMLFVFPQDSMPGFWMKDMLTPIDMIWVTDNGTIVAINASVSPNTYPQSFYPPDPIRYVLETRAGFAAEKGWTVGTHVQLPLPY